MVERELRSKEDFLKIIVEICESKGIERSKLEKEAGISIGMIDCFFRQRKTIQNITSLCIEQTRR